MKRTLSTTALSLAAILLAGIASAQEGWVKYDAQEYGFSMLIPEGTKLAEREYGGGWGELRAEHEGVKLYALAKLGEWATPEQIEQVGVKLTGIPGSFWTTVSQGENKQGWTWYRTVQARGNGKVIVGDYGTGKRGSYLLILETTEADFKQYEPDYVKWYQSIRLH